MRWNGLKSIIDNKHLLYQVITIPDYYYIIAYNGPIKYECIIYRDSDNINIAGLDSEQEKLFLIDFESNYLSGANKILDERTVDGIHKVAQSNFLDNIILFLNGGMNKEGLIDAPANQITTKEFTYTFDIYFKGTWVWWFGANWGDFLECEAGYYLGEDWISLNKYGWKLPIYQDNLHGIYVKGTDDVILPAGLVIRVYYNNIHASNSAKAIVWLDVDIKQE